MFFSMLNKKEKILLIVGLVIVLVVLIGSIAYMTGVFSQKKTPVTPTPVVTDTPEPSPTEAPTAAVAPSQTAAAPPAADNAEDDQIGEKIAEYLATGEYSNVTLLLKNTEPNYKTAGYDISKKYSNERLGLIKDDIALISNITYENSNYMMDQFRDPDTCASAAIFLKISQKCRGYKTISGFMVPPEKTGNDTKLTDMGTDEKMLKSAHEHGMDHITDLRRYTAVVDGGNEPISIYVALDGVRSLWCIYTVTTNNVNTALPSVNTVRKMEELFAAQQDADIGGALDDAVSMTDLTERQ